MNKVKHFFQKSVRIFYYSYTTFLDPGVRFLKYEKAIDFLRCLCYNVIITSSRRGNFIS